MGEQDHSLEQAGFYYDSSEMDLTTHVAQSWLEPRPSSFQRDRKIVHILENITQGGYGLCPDCHGETYADSSQPLPFASFCMSCQDKLERKCRDKYRLL